MDLDCLIHQAVVDAQVMHGDKIGEGARPLIVQEPKKRGNRGRSWTPDEDAYYLANVARMTYAEIGQHLGRSAEAVKTHQFRRGLQPPSRQPGYLTGNQVGQLLGIDSHKPATWIELGVLPGERIASPVGRGFHRISWIRFKMWLVKPESWIYFDARKIKNPALQHLVKRAKERWGDEWWIARQVANYLKVDVGIFDQNVRRGTLSGIQAKYLGGRDFKAMWSFWFFRKSDILKLHVFRGKGRVAYPWPAGADAFLLRAREQGWTHEHIARAMKWGVKRVAYRLKLLHAAKTYNIERRDKIAEERFIDVPGGVMPPQLLPPGIRRSYKIARPA